MRDDRGVRPARRRVVWAVGLAALGVYVGGAWLSATISPAARRPILDGSGFCQPYRFVDPPPELVHQNRAPEAGDFTIGFTDGSSEAGVFGTLDQQAAIVLSRGAVAPKEGATSVHLTVDPVDPATVAAPPQGQFVLGNAYRVTAVYEPSGGPVGAPLRPSLVTLSYPSLSTERSDRTVLFSADGKTWSKLETTDSPNDCQAQATPTMLGGLFAVSTSGRIIPSTSPGATGSSSALPWIVIGAAVVVAGALVALRLRARSSSGPPAKQREDAEPPPQRPASGSPRGTSSRRRPPKKRRR